MLTTVFDNAKPDVWLDTTKLAYFSETSLKALFGDRFYSLFQAWVGHDFVFVLEQKEPVYLVADVREFIQAMYNETVIKLFSAQKSVNFQKQISA